MSKNLDKLRGLLAELFQLNQADLDFGIYRIMNQKRAEITAFLDNDLLPQVRSELTSVRDSETTEAKTELDKLVQQLTDAGVDPDTSPKVRELRERYSTGGDLDVLENEVFSHLYDFFRRYYDEGDFISQRRYKEGVYAIPYEGEEVKVYWANHDQYYVKSTENFRDYAFKLPSGKRVHFKVVEAALEKDNRKAAQGSERRFLLHEELPIEEANGELIVRFEFRPDPDKRKAAAINSATAERITQELTAGDFDSAWVQGLATKMPTDKSPDRTLLDKQLTDYTARNTFDYFIHKHLGHFLRRELDFYIKNEIMHLDDIEGESAPRVEQYLSKVRAVRRIAHKIIDFLAQIEAFQKKLWLKKKFVVETNYCITLDRIPEEFYPEIAANEAQREEWVRLFAIDELRGDLAAQPYSDPLSPAFLKDNGQLVLDTANFSRSFVDRLLGKLQDIDASLGGVILHGDSFQGLRFLVARYFRAVKACYIDPPYNTGNDDFVYKDDYQHSTWLSMLADRISLASNVLGETGLIFCSLDDNECARAKLAVDRVLGSGSFVSDIAVVNNLKGRQDKAHIATAHEHLLMYRMPDGQSYGLPLSEERLSQFDQRDSKGDAYELRDLRRRGGGDRREDRPNMFYPIFWDQREEQAYLERHGEEDVEIHPKRSDGSDGRWRWGVERVRSNLDILEAKPVPHDGRWNVYYRVYAKRGDGGERRSKPKSLWQGPQYSTDIAGKTLRSMFPAVEFTAPKPVAFIEDIIQHSAKDGDTVLDFTAGSGTVAHACISLQQERRMNVGYILVEMAEHFDTVMLPRIKKAVYSSDWKRGKPVSRKGVSHMFKYVRLESYEDTLNNLGLSRTDQQQDLLTRSDAFREDYTLRYMLDVESRGSPSLLNIEQFEDPFDYRLNIATGNVGETKPVSVDLVETFNYLIGLTVRHIDTIRGVKVVDGTNPKNERILILWRKVKEVDNDALNAWFKKQGYNTQDMEYDIIYVNGDNNLENLRRPDQTWKVRLIEQDFHRLMFDVEDV